MLLFARPDEIELLGLEVYAGPNAFEARVEKSTYLGDTMDYRLTFGQGLELRVQTDARRRHGQGGTIRVRLPRVRSWAMTDA